MKCPECGFEFNKEEQIGILTCRCPNCLFVIFNEED